MPVRPDQAQLFADLREGFAAVAQKLRPVQNSARHAARLGLGVQDMAQPEQTSVGEAEAVAAIERLG